MARKRKSKPTTRARSYLQEVRDRYAHAREDAQLLGLIETMPEEALKPERVDPMDQSDQPLPNLVGRAIRKGWATPEEKQPALVDEMVSIVEAPEADLTTKVAAYRALLQGDQVQYERDHPEEAGKAKGGGSNTNVTIIDWNTMTVAPEIVDPVKVAIEKQQNVNGANDETKLGDQANSQRQEGSQESGT